MNETATRTGANRAPAAAPTAAARGAVVRSRRRAAHHPPPTVAVTGTRTKRRWAGETATDRAPQAVPPREIRAQVAPPARSTIGMPMAATPAPIPTFGRRRMVTSRTAGPPAPPPALADSPPAAPHAAARAAGRATDQKGDGHACVSPRPANPGPRSIAGS